MRWLHTPVDLAAGMQGRAILTHAAALSNQSKALMPLCCHKKGYINLSHFIKFVF